MTTEQKVKRKLRAILSADVKGYSRLMTEDEAYTIKTLKEYRNIMSEIIKQHSGSVVDAPGDNLLAEFSSAVNAVQCSVEIQNELRIRNTDIQYNKRLEFRIGVNIGDVVQDGDSLYGEGVNIAARIEGLADPGGVCISRGAYDHIRNKLNFGYEYLGEHSVKNIKHPVRVYKILMEPVDAGKLIGEKPTPVLKSWVWSTIIVVVIVLTLIGYQLFQKITTSEFEPASIEKMAFPLPEKPSIAVLPFDNLSNDPDQEYFSDGMTDELICDLAKIENILVISRNSTFTYKGKPTKAQEIAKDLNVRYILEGSVQRYGNQVRIRAQLIDGKTDHHIWSESYDGIMDDIFKLQDKITGKIVSALSIKLSVSEQSKLTEKGTHSIPAHDAYLKGMAHLRLWTPDDLVKAIKYFEEAVELDPNYGQGYTALAEAYGFNIVGGIKYWEKTGKNYRESYIFRRHYIGLAMKNPVPKTFALFAISKLKLRHYNEVIKYAEKAVTAAPNDAGVLYSAGLALFWAGKPQESLKYLKKSNRLEPLHRSAVFMVCPYFSLKLYEKAVASFEKNIPNVRNLTDILAFAAASYGYLGQKEEAKATLDKWLGNMSGRPGVDFWYGIYSFRYFEAFDHLMKGLKKAGRDGSITTSFKVNGKYKLTGTEIKALMFGKTEAASGFYFYEELFHRKENGEVLYQVGDSVKKGISWIKNDMLCNKFDEIAGGCDDCADIYKNPLGEYAFKNEYLKVTDYGIILFSIKR